METRSIARIAIVGAGLMGHGIGMEFAACGHPVGMYDLDDDLLRQARIRIAESLGRLVDAGRVDAADIPEILSRVTFSTSLEDTVAHADIVIEAVSENLPLKQEIFAWLDRLCPEHTILASNTSSFMPSLLAVNTRRPDRVIVAHYFNPPFLLPAVEVVPSPQTSEATIATVTDLLSSIGKAPVVLRTEAPGFIANRLQMALLREAFAIAGQGIATPQEIDAVVRNGFGRRLAAAGPFEIGEAAGWDVWHAIAVQLLPDICSATEVPNLLRERFERGEFGLKSGLGFYEWSDDAARDLRGRIAETLLHLAQTDVPDTMGLPLGSVYDPEV